MHPTDSLLLQNILFWSFAAIALLGAASVVVARNPVRAVLSLILTFVGTAVTWLILQAEFLAITLVLVYVGAVLVLFLFIVMMLDINFATIQAAFTRWLPIGLLLAVGLFLAIAMTLHQNPFIFNPQEIPLAYGEGASNTELLGNIVFHDFLLQFEMAGALMLVAIIAAISLIHRGPQSRKMQVVSRQVDVDPKRRVRLLDEI